MYKELRSCNGEVKPCKLPHKLDWYIDGHLARRPANGIYALARLAEFLLHKVKFNKRGHSAALPEVMEFFADTRRAMRDVLTSCSIDTKIPSKLQARLSERMNGLIAHAKQTLEVCELLNHQCKCPACKNGKLYVNDAELLEYILVERSKAGVIPRESLLYRESPLT
jgi:hypothetical protein